MQQQVTISMQYQAWLDMIDRLEQIITKIESGTEVTDPGAVSELEQIRGILSSPLTVQDSAAQTELTAIKNALSGVLNMKASDTDAELSLIKEKLEDIETKLNGTLTTQLTGREVEQITLLDALAFTGTVGSNPIAVIPFNAQKYKDFEISIINTLSDTGGNPIPVAVGFVNNGASEVYLDDGTRALYSYYVADNRVYSEIPATGRLYYLSDIPITGTGAAQGKSLNTPNIWKLFKANNNTPQITFGFVDRTQEAASGSLSCWLEGVPN